LYVSDTVTSKYSRNHFISEKYKTAKLIELLFSRYICFKIIPFSQYTLLPATVQVMQTFLKAILLVFSFFLRILNDAISITKTPPLQCFISVDSTGKNQL
jgi:hypothetical protein